MLIVHMAQRWIKTPSLYMSNAHTHNPAFCRYRSMYVQQHARFNGPTLSGSGLCTTDFLHHEAALAQKCGQAWEVVCKHEAMHSLVAKAAHTSSGNYFQQRRQLVQLALQLSSCLQLPDQVTISLKRLLFEDNSVRVDLLTSVYQCFFPKVSRGPGLPLFSRDLLSQLLLFYFDTGPVGIWVIGRGCSRASSCM